MSERADERPPAHFGFGGERVRSPADRQPFTTVEAGQSGQGLKGLQRRSSRSFRRLRAIPAVLKTSSGLSVSMSLSIRMV